MKNNKKIIGKISTIWRQLGHSFEPLNHKMFQAALHEFQNIQEKKSFILLLPYILDKIGRQDLCKFCKKPTQLLQIKYNLYVNETNWDEIRSLGGNCNENRLRFDQGQIHAKQERESCERGS